MKLVHKHDHRFGPKTFAAWANAELGRDPSDETVDLSPRVTTETLPTFGGRDSRLDHGFIATGVYPLLKRLAGSTQVPEVAVISRTYLSDDEIEATPPGVRSIILPTDPVYWGEDEHGTPLATFLSAPTPEALPFAQVFRELSGYWLPWILPEGDTAVCLSPGRWNDPLLTWAADPSVNAGELWQ